MIINFKYERMCQILCLLFTKRNYVQKKCMFMVYLMFKLYVHIYLPP